MIRAILLLSCFSLLACSDSSGVVEVDSAAKSRRVSVATATLQEVEYSLTALGSVESMQQPTISSETSGQVISISVSEGQAITAGTQMVSVDNTLHKIEADKAAAELQRQEVLYENQQREVSRLLQLRKSQSVSMDRLEDEQAQLAMLRAQRDVARKQHEQALYLESKTRVMAPAGGLVARRFVSLGDYVTPGLPLFDLVSVDRLRARLSFPERDAASITVGKTVELSSPAAPGPVALGQVTSINPRIDPNNRALEVTVEFDNPGGWYPGASVDARLVVERNQQAVTVPALSVVQRGGKAVVFVLDGEESVRERRVTLGQQEADWVELVGGLESGEVVVVQGSSLVTDGSRVLVMRENPAGNAAP